MSRSARPKPRATQQDLPRFRTDEELHAGARACALNLLARQRITRDELRVGLHYWGRYGRIEGTTALLEELLAEGKITAGQEWLGTRGTLTTTYRLAD